MKLDRLLGIVTVLLQKERVTAPYLAHKFEVSRRTIGRDIDALCRAGIPVCTTQGAGGGISIAQGYKLDKSILTADELRGMIAALKGLGSVTDQPAIERTLLKLHANSDAVVSLKEPILIDLGSHHKGSLTRKIELLKRAILEHRLVEFDYHYEKGVSHRRIEPCFVTFQWMAWYVFGYCLDRQDWRLFKLARLWELNSCEQGFVPREIPAKRMELSGHLTDYKSLVALFDASARHQLVEVYGPDCFTEQPDGRLRFEAGYTNRDFILSWILSFGDRAKVVEPLDIAQEIGRIAGNMLDSYRVSEG